MNSQPQKAMALPMTSLIAVVFAGLTPGCTLPPGFADEGNTETEAEDDSTGGENADFTDDLDPGDHESDRGEDDDADPHGSDDGASEPPDDAGTGDPDSGTSEAGDEGSADDSGGCEPVERHFSQVPSSVMLVLDKSTTTMNPWEGAMTTDSRWSWLHAAVTDMSVMFNDSLDLGLQLFPKADAGASESEGACEIADQVDVPVGPDHASAIQSAMPGPHDPVSGKSPATAAVDLALDHLRDLPDDGHKAMILVTNGAANCAGPDTNAYDDTLATVVGDAYWNDRIPTHVVGLGIKNAVDDAPGGSGVNFWERLNDVADHGGVPTADPNEHFYNVHDGTTLAETLQSIAAQEACVFDLDGDLPPVDFTVSIDDNDLGFVSDCKSENGWAWANTGATFGSLRLCGTACDQFLSHGKATVTYGCR